MDKKPPSPNFTRQEKKEFAERMANNPTPAELVLYTALSTARMRYIKQYIVSGFILDAYLPDLKIGIECDGGYHNTAAQRLYDSNRDKAIEKCGIRVLRFKNGEVLNNPMQIIYVIRGSKGIKKRSKHKRASVPTNVVVAMNRKKGKRFLGPEEIKVMSRLKVDEFERMAKMPSSEYIKTIRIKGSSVISGSKNPKRGRAQRFKPSR